MECFRIQFPKGEDANSYARAVRPAEKSLGVAIRSAEWLGAGAKPALTTRCLNSVHQWVDGEEVLQTAALRTAVAPTDARSAEPAADAVSEPSVPPAAPPETTLPLAASESAPLESPPAAAMPEPQANTSSNS